MAKWVIYLLLLLCLGIDPAADSDSIYDLNAAWEAMRKRHALECQSFIIEHQKRALQFFGQKVDSGRVRQHVSDLYEDWKGKYGNFLTAEASLHTQNVCKSFMELVIRHEIPRMKSRLSEAAEARKQQASALLDAETRFQSMGPHMLIALIELDKHAVQVSKADGVKAKRVELQKSSQLAALVRKFPDLNKHFEIKFTDELARKSTTTRRRQATPHPKGRGRARSASKRFAGHSRGQSKSPHRSTSRQSASSRSSRASSGRSSRGSSNSQTQWKGKGKGKAKGHPRSKGKGRGNMSRDRGDFPKSILKKTVSFKGSRHSWQLPPSVHSSRPSRRRCKSYWNSDLQSINFAKYCVSRSFCITMSSLSMRTVGQSVHSRMPPEFVLPDFVKLYLNKGSKYILDRHQCSLAEVMRSLDKMEVKMHTASFLSQSLHLPNSKWPSSTPAQNGSLLKMNRWPGSTVCFVSLSWMSLLQDQSSATTLGWIAKQGNGWSCIETIWSLLMLTKALEIVLYHENGWTQNSTVSWAVVLLDLRQMFTKLEALKPDACWSVSQEKLRTLVWFQTKTVQFILHQIFKAGEGSFRLRVKLHKQPMTGRPIANLSYSWLAPACLFLCEVLAPIQNNLQHVVSSSFEFLQKMSKHVPSHFEIATIDIKNLYPSINTDHLLEVLSHDVLRFYCGSRKAVYTVSLLQVVLRNQFIVHRGEAYQAFGIATGIPPGVFLANIYVSHVDTWSWKTMLRKLLFTLGWLMIQWSVLQTLILSNGLKTHGGLNWFGKWLVVVGVGMKQNNLLRFWTSSFFIAVGWCSGKHTESHWTITFTFPRQAVTQSPLQPASYVARTHRMWRINKSKSDLMKHLRFFASKFSMRGYSLTGTWKIICDTLAKLHGGSKPKVKKRQFFTVLRYSSSVPKRTLKQCFDKHADSLRIFQMTLLSTWHFLYRKIFSDCITMTIGSSSCAQTGWWEGSVFLNLKAIQDDFAHLQAFCLKEPRVEQDLDGRNRFLVIAALWWNSPFSRLQFDKLDNLVHWRKDEMVVFHGFLYVYQFG